MTINTPNKFYASVDAKELDLLIIDRETSVVTADIQASRMDVKAL